MWFDTPEQTTRKQSIALEQLVRRLQPRAIVNTRVGNAVGDVEEMGDNQIPARATGRDFEVPATMAESWGYSTLDTPPYWKSSTRLIRHLVDIASKGGNFLLNIGPDGRGAIPPASQDRLSAIGRWMALVRRVHLRHVGLEQGAARLGPLHAARRRALRAPLRVAGRAVRAARGRVVHRARGTADRREPVPVTWSPSYGASVVLTLPGGRRRIRTCRCCG